MKFKKDNGASLTGFVITILVILLVIAVAGCVYLIKNPIKENVAIQTPTDVQANMSNDEKIEEKDENSSSLNINIVDNNEETNLVIINDEQNIKAEGKISEYISEEGSSAEVPVEISYIVNGNNKGKLQIKYNNKVVHTKNTEKNIIEFNRLRDAYDSDIFVLYEDGTVGKISIANIKNNKYDIVKVENCKNIVRIQELVFEYEDSGADYALVAVDSNGKIVTLATYNV